MWEWLHHLFNPHCVQCREEEFVRAERIRLENVEYEDREDKRNACRTCQVYEMVNAQLLADNQRLLDIILHGKEVEQLEQNSNVAQTVPQTIQPPVNWRERRRILEQESRETARVLHEQQESLLKARDVVELEKSLQVDIPVGNNA